jgi:hypothetical protein
MCEKERARQEIAIRLRAGASKYRKPNSFMQLREDAFAPESTSARALNASRHSHAIQGPMQPRRRRWSMALESVIEMSHSPAVS